MALLPRWGRVFGRFSWSWRFRGQDWVQPWNAITRAIEVEVLALKAGPTLVGLPSPRPVLALRAAVANASTADIGPVSAEAVAAVTVSAEAPAGTDPGPSRGRRGRAA